MDGAKNGLAIYFRNSGMDGHGRNIVTGSAVASNHPGHLAPAWAARGRRAGMEGTTFNLCKFFQTVDPAFGYMDPPIYLYDCGLSLTFNQCQPQELVHSAAMLIIAEHVSITNLTFTDMFCNTNSDAARNTRTRYSTASICGSVQWANFERCCIQDYPGFGITATGHSPTDTVFEWVDAAHDHAAQRQGRLLRGFSRAATLRPTGFLSPKGIFRSRFRAARWPELLRHRAAAPVEILELVPAAVGPGRRSACHGCADRGGRRVRPWPRLLRCRRSAQRLINGV